MGNRSERSFEQQDPWEREISELHGRLLDYLRQKGDSVHITYDDNENVDSACCSYTFQILRDGEITYKEFLLSSEVYECNCEDEEGKYPIPDDIEIHLGFNEENTLLVSPDIAVIINPNGSILRDADESDFWYFESILVSSSTPPLQDIIPNPDDPMGLN